MSTEAKKSFQTLINGTTPVLVDFFATWCGPCQMMPPILKELKGNLGDKIHVLKVDVDKNAQIASQLKISGVPTMMLFKEGEVKWRQSGVLSAADIERQISSYL